MKKRIYAVVSGIVQGVGYRFFTYRKGNALGISGFVRNLPDGSVDVLMEGEENSLIDMINYLKQGPYSARVDNIDFSWDDYKGEFNSFQILFC